MRKRVCDTCLKDWTQDCIPHGNAQVIVEGTVGAALLEENARLRAENEYLLKKFIKSEQGRDEWVCVGCSSVLRNNTVSNLKDLLREAREVLQLEIEDGHHTEKLENLVARVDSALGENG